MASEQFGNVQSDIESLINASKKRDGERRTWKLLRRNINPSTTEVVTNDTTPMEIHEALGRETSKRMMHNDAGTFFILALHMLTHRGPRWKAAIRANDRENSDEMRKKGIAERHMESIWGQNDTRLVNAGKQRFSRHLLDPALETGTSVYFRTAQVFDGDIQFIMEPLDSNRVFFEFDTHGLSRVVYKDRKRIKALIADAKASDRFDISELNKKKNKNDKVTVLDYWERTFTRMPGKGLVEEFSHAMHVDDGIEYLPFHKDEGAREIPYQIHRYNGEAFPGDQTDDDELDNILGRSILAENVKVFIDKHEFLEKIDKHIDQVVNADTFDITRGARPRLNPNKFLSRVESTNTSYDIGEAGPQFIRLNPIDQASQFRWLDLEAGRQRGSVPDLLHGNLSIELSGFAISQVLESSEASVGTFNVVYKFLLGNLAQWVIDETKRLAADNELNPTQIVGEVPNTGAREMQFEDVDFSKDLPDTTIMFVENELAKPSDLTERISQARQLDPTGGALATRQSIWDNLLWDIVQDPYQEGNGIMSQLLENLPEIQKIEFMRELELRALALEAEGGKDSALHAKAIRDSIENIKSTLTQGQTPTPGDARDSGVRQEVDPTERRGAEGRATSPAPQQTATGTQV